MDFYKGVIPILDDSAASRDVLHPKNASYGTIPRDFSIDPIVVSQTPTDLQVIDPSEWDARYDEQEALKSSLEHLYLPDPNGPPSFEFLDQDGFPDCWAHSTAHAIMFDRLRRGLPPVRLNAVAVATLLKQTNGGWCGLSTRFAVENGYPEVGTGPGQWPYQSRRGSDTPELRAKMANYKVEENWYDLGHAAYEQHLAEKQLTTLGFSNVPTPMDNNPWSHSICRIRTVRVERGLWKPLILNSWAGWGHFGLAVLNNSYATADNAVGIRSTVASAP